MKWMSKQVVTVGFVGYLPAPGTCATLVTCGLVKLLQDAVGIGLCYLICVGVIGLFVWQGIARALSQNTWRNDPPEIVLDEVLGTLLTFVGVSLTWLTGLVGVLLFRFFDIRKPGGIKKMERYAGAWGVMLDDVVAGILSNGILLVLVRVYSYVAAC